VGNLPTANGDVETGVVLDAINDPGVELLATFLPAAGLPGGIRRIAATQTVTATVSIDFNNDLPIYWMASVLRRGDIAPNQLAQAYSSISDEFEFSFGEELVVAHEGGAWLSPHYDTNEYSLNVGFGIGRSVIAWGYSVPCQPGQPVSLDAGSYQFVRSNGQSAIGDPVADNLEAWTMPLGFQYSLVFDQCGNGSLSGGPAAGSPRVRLTIAAGGAQPGPAKPGRF